MNYKSLNSDDYHNHHAPELFSEIWFAIEKSGNSFASLWFIYKETGWLTLSRLWKNCVFCTPHHDRVKLSGCGLRGGVPIGDWRHP